MGVVNTNGGHRHGPRNSSLVAGRTDPDHHSARALQPPLATHKSARRAIAALSRRPVTVDKNSLEISMSLGTIILIILIIALLGGFSGIGGGPFYGTGYYGGGGLGLIIVILLILLLLGKI
jgi:hypothetical protein